MSSKTGKPKPKVVKLKKRKIKIKSKKSCEILQTEYDEGKIVKSINNPAVVRNESVIHHFLAVCSK